MNLIRTPASLGLLALAGIASPLAAADSGWYTGANVGLSRAHIHDRQIIDGLLGDGYLTPSYRDDEHDIGFKLFGGYQFGRYFALEGGYFNLGEFGFDATTLPAGTLSGNIELHGVNLDAVGILPLGRRLSAFGRVGVNYAEAETSFSGTGAVNVLDPDRSQRAANYKFGFGLGYDFTDALGMRLEAERYRVDDAVGNEGDIDLLSLGLLYRFGGTPPPPPPRPAPPPIVARPMPPPPAPMPPPPPAPTRVTFSADSLFDFDKAAIKPAGQQDLAAFAAKLRSTQYEVITVTGHTDRIGSQAYNMALSTRRAEAVKAYLVETAGVPAAKIAARGVNGSDPVTKPGSCTSSSTGKATKELIACLQPDRRVEVEVSGTK